MGNLLMLEPWWLEWIFYDFSHFDNALLKGLPDCLSLNIGHVLELYGFTR